jgi:hypothetical protein
VFPAGRATHICVRARRLAHEGLYRVGAATDETEWFFAVALGVVIEPV